VEALDAERLGQRDEVGVVRQVCLLIALLE